jgi:hypothetical protein
MIDVVSVLATLFARRLPNFSAPNRAFCDMLMALVGVAARLDLVLGIRLIEGRDGGYSQGHWV